MIATLRVVPLLSAPLAAFVLCALALGAGWTSSTIVEADMFSGAHWAISFGDVFVFASLLVLFVEIVKSVNTGATEIVNHGLSMLVAITCTILFVTGAAFTNSTFFLLTTMSFIDVVAGFVITIVAARRDFGTAH
jgi:hypothetical protein